MEPLPKIISVSEKIYRKLLRVYPQAHRRDYAEQMSQLFRDQCRDVWRAKRSAGIVKLWLRVLPDVAKTSVIEQIAAIERNQIMKYLNAKNVPTILTVVGLLLGIFSLCAHSQNSFLLLMVASAVAVLVKAIIEVFRPSNEWLSIAIRTFVLMFFYALFMPAWAKMQGQFAVVTTGMPPLEMYENFGRVNPFVSTVEICLFVNPTVTAFKFLQFLIQRRRS